jgi:hypothetical protein
MRELTFNEWMLYIYEQNNYSPEKLKSYEQSIRTETAIQNHQPRLNQGRGTQHGGPKSVAKITQDCE